MKCSRKNVRTVLERMIEAKANHLFMQNNVVYGRWTRVLKHWWLRGLDESKCTDSISSEPEKLIEDFKMRLDWNNEADGAFFDRQGVSLLIYAVSANNIKVTEYTLDEISKIFGDNTQERARRVESRISKDGYLQVGIPGSCTALIGAMTFASPEMVQLLLELFNRAFLFIGNKFLFLFQSTHPPML